jgi:hypothetical protein
MGQKKIIIWEPSKMANMICFSIWNCLLYNQQVITPTKIPKKLVKHGHN